MSKRSTRRNDQRSNDAALTPEQQRVLAALARRVAPADAAGVTSPGREHFDSDAEYRAARAWR